MDFYGIDFLRGHSEITDYIWYILIFSLLVVLLIVLGLSLRHRLNTKYRELSLIVLLLLMFSLGVQYSNYKINQSKRSQSSQMVAFLQSLSKSQEVSVTDIYANSTQFNDSVIVLINDKYYRVTFDADQKTYTLTDTYLVDSKVNIIKK